MEAASGADPALPRYTVTAIAWDRVILRLELAPEGRADDRAEGSGTDPIHQDPAPDDVTFEIRDATRRLAVPAQALGEGRYRLSLNITTFAARRQIPDGTWSIFPVWAGVTGPAVAFPLDRLGELDAASRLFLYNGNQTCYTVTFGITENDTDPEFLLRAYQFFRSGKAAGGGTPAARLRRTLLSRRNMERAAQAILRASQLRPRRRPRILFASDMRSALEGNLLAVRDRMTARGLDTYFELDYSFRPPGSSDRGHTARVLWQMGAADILLIDDYFPLLETITLRPGTRIIQLWHAGSGFKSVGLSRFGRYGSPKLQNAHRSYTYAICGSRHLVPVYAEAFGIEESAVLPTGLPRIDAFLDPEAAAAAVARVHADHPQLTGKRMVLFAPTFRGRDFRDAYYPLDRLDLRRLADELGPDTVLCLRMHHFANSRPVIPADLADRIVDLTGYGVTNDVLHATDVLVTDYSSIIYEFSLLGRPMVFYAFDKDIYSATRGFHRSFDETAPGRVVTTFEDLVRTLRTEDYERWKAEAYVAENFDHIDRHSSDRVIDQLILSDPRLSAVPAPAQAAAVGTLPVPRDGQDG